MAGPDRRAVWPLLAAVIGMALTSALGVWQLGRGHEKRDLKERLEAHATQPPINISTTELAARDVELRSVEARGVFEPRYAVFLDNRTRHGVPGYHVLMPLRVGGDRYVLVNRGWVAGFPDRSRVPEVRTPRDEIAVQGIAVVPGKRIFELSKDVIEGQVWQNVTIERYRKAMPIAVQPFVIQQDSALDDGLVREWPVPDYGIDKHYGYAFQWFALAATIAAFYTITHVRNRKR